MFVGILWALRQCHGFLQIAHKQRQGSLVLRPKTGRLKGYIGDFDAGGAAIEGGSDWCFVKNNNRWLLDMATRVSF